MVAKKRGQDTPRDYHTRACQATKGGSFVFVYTFRIVRLATLTVFGNDHKCLIIVHPK